VEIQKLNEICDFAISSGDLSKLDSLIKQLRKRIKNDDVSDHENITYHYLIGNMLCGIADHSKEDWFSWLKGQYPEHKVQAMNAYRTASVLADKIESPIKYEIRANLANELAHQRRTFEALELWHSDFSIAGDSPYVSTCAKIRELIFLHYYLNDPGHAKCYCVAAYQLLQKLEKHIEGTDHPQILHHVRKSDELANLRDFGKVLPDDDFR